MARVHVSYVTVFIMSLHMVLSERKMIEWGYLKVTTKLVDSFPRIKDLPNI